MISCVVLCIPALMSDKTQSTTFSIATAVYFSIVALLLIWSLINLLLTFRRDLPGELTTELSRIVIFLVYFSVAFATRAVAIILVYFHHWPQFNRFWENKSFNPDELALWGLQFILYSDVPIGYLAVIHFLNFRGSKTQKGNTPNTILDELDG